MRWLLIVYLCGLAYLLFDFKRYQERLNPRMKQQTPVEIAEATDKFVRKLPIYGTA